METLHLCTMEQLRRPVAGDIYPVAEELQASGKGLIRLLDLDLGGCGGDRYNSYRVPLGSIVDGGAVLDPSLFFAQFSSVMPSASSINLHNYSTYLLDQLDET